MNKLNLGFGLALILGGVVTLAFQVWGPAALLLVIGILAVLVELRARRRRIFQTKQSGDTYEIGKARGLAAASQGIKLHHEGGI